MIIDVHLAMFVTPTNWDPLAGSLSRNNITNLLLNNEFKGMVSDLIRMCIQKGHAFENFVLKVLDWNSQNGPIRRYRTFVVLELYKREGSEYP